MAALPTGVVTFLFTDVEGSTRLVQRVGDRYPALLDEHRRLLRNALARHAGHEFGTEGDACFYAFADPVDAASAAADAQRALAANRWPNDAELRVRMGIHTGEAGLLDGDYVGLDVHRVARVTAAAHGGQVLLSAATRRLLGRSCDVVDLGEHRLKDLLEPERLYQLLVDGLPAEFPPPRTLGHRPTNLPVQPNPVVGREQELERLRDLIRSEDVRLLTLTGPGGIGKTRLALQLCADVLDDFDNGVFVITLASVRDPSLVAPAVAQALAVREVAGETLVETLGAYLSERKLLLLVDNFEQVVDSAPLITSLLRAGPAVKVVVTSRERLRLAGEQVFEVPPLSTADGSSGAVELFLARAQALQPDFTLTEGNTPAVAAVCSRLDGLPLAIELAAARSTLLSPQELFERLERRLPLLTGGARDVDERQQTLRNTIAWSFELLAPPEQALFARLAVFAGGCRLEDAEAVCNRDGAGDVLDGLQALVDKSLIRQRRDVDGAWRFWMLETMREYGLERLDQLGEAAAVLAGFAERYLALACTGEEGLRGSGQVEWLERLAAERDNFAAALEWALEPSAERERALLGLRLAGALGRFWYYRANIREGTAWLERALAADDGSTPEFRAKAIHNLGILVGEAGDHARAIALFEEALVFHRAAGNRSRLAVSLNSLGVVARNQGDPRRARELLEESLELRRELGDATGIATALCNLGVAAIDDGDLDRARSLFEESLGLDEAEGDRLGIAVNLRNLGAVALEAGDHAKAAGRLADALRGFVEVGDQDGIAETLEDIAALAAARSRPRRAAQLAGAATALRDEIGSPMYEVDRVRLERHLGVARDALGAEAFAAELELGKGLGAGGAQAEALLEVSE